jgi:hypothetical protein
MAITQKDIIDSIPAIIDADSWDLLSVLLSLTGSGWGGRCKLYQEISVLVNLSIYAKENKYKFDRELFSTSIINCDRCWDEGVITPLDVLLNDDLVGEEYDIPCPNCSTKKAVQG